MDTGVEVTEWSPDASSVFERVITELSTTFIGLPATDIDDRIEHAIRLLAQVADADRAAVVERSDGQDGFARTHLWTRHGVPRGAHQRLSDAEWQVVAEAYPWGRKRVLTERQPLVVHSLGELPPDAATDRQTFEALGIRSVAVFPLVAGDAVLGAVSFAAMARQRRWPRDLVERLQLAVNVLANALARRRAELILGRALGFERLIAELSATGIDLPASEVDAHITGVLERVARFLDLDRSSVHELSRDAAGLQLTHQWAREDSWRVPPFVPADAIPWVCEMLLRGQEIVLNCVEDLPGDAAQEREFARLHGPKSSAVFPLTVGGSVIGGVTFGAIREPRTWSADVVERLRLVSHIIAGALARKRADQEIQAVLADNERLRRRLEAENAYLQTELGTLHDFDEIVGRSPAIRAALHKADQVAPTDVPVLLLGETGTGKDLIAHAIHTRSTRGGRPLIVVNCAALPSTLIESELFGHEKGAFTGAIQARAGRFELADGSTLFLDEIGDLDPALQAKLLRALQGGEIQRVGSSKSLKVNVRVIAATNRDLELATREGRFRADLYYRLSVFPIRVPGLTERREDIPLLVWHFIQSRQRTLGRLVTKIAPKDMEALVAYDWPGNVRELQNVIDRALILSIGSTLRLTEAFGAARGVRNAASDVAAVRRADNLRDAERAHILDVLARCHWMIEGHGQAADRLGLRPSTLRNRMNKLGIRRPRPG